MINNSNFGFRRRRNQAEVERMIREYERNRQRDMERVREMLAQDIRGRDNLRNGK